MPPHLKTGSGGEGPLEENQFVVEGYSLNFTEFAVVDEACGEPCHVQAEVEETCEVAARWAEQGPPYPPGAVQLRGLARVRFWPAHPGRWYRLESTAGTLRREYRGPQIAADGTPAPPEA